MRGRGSKIWRKSERERNIERKRERREDKRKRERQKNIERKSEKRKCEKRKS